jgi:hypothetical protein
MPPVVEGAPVDPMTLGEQWASAGTLPTGMRVFVSDRTLSPVEVVPLSAPAGHRLGKCSACQGRAAYAVGQPGERDRPACVNHAHADAVAGYRVRALLYLPA